MPMARGCAARSVADVVILIPAAGAATRMRGGDKLLEPVEGEAQLARLARAALATGAHVIVTLGDGQGGRKAVLRPAERLRIVTLPDAAEGMAASLRRGADLAQGAAGLMVVPGDMPELNTHDLQILIAHFSSDPKRPCRATAEDGTPGHPVILPQRLFSEIMRLQGDAGARSLLDGEEVRRVALPGQRATTDLDTPEDWARWRALQSRNGNNPGH